MKGMTDRELIHKTIWELDHMGLIDRDDTLEITEWKKLDDLIEKLTYVASKEAIFIII